MLNKKIVIYTTEKGKHRYILIEHQWNTTNLLTCDVTNIPLVFVVFTPAYFNQVQSKPVRCKKNHRKKQTRIGLKRYVSRDIRVVACWSRLYTRKIKDLFESFLGDTMICYNITILPFRTLCVTYSSVDVCYIHRIWPYCIWQVILLIPRRVHCVSTAGEV